jgi:hypothetical protein
MPDASGDSGPTFQEEQRMTYWWVWAIVVAITLLAWWGFVVQIVLGRPWGTNPGPDWVIEVVFVFAGLALPAFLVGTGLVTVVTKDALRLHYRFLRRRTLPFAEIRSAEAVTYHPILEYGGWGLRWAPGRGWAWTVRGDRAVRLVLANGKTLLVGSQRADDLVRALTESGVGGPRPEGG